MEITSVCPYCGKEMRDGAIPVLRDIYWCPRGEDGMLKDGFGDEKEQVWLGTPCWACRMSLRKIIIR